MRYHWFRTKLRQAGQTSLNGRAWAYRTVCGFTTVNHSESSCCSPPLITQIHLLWTLPVGSSACSCRYAASRCCFWCSSSRQRSQTDVWSCVLIHSWLSQLITSSSPRLWSPVEPSGRRVDSEGPPRATASANQRLAYSCHYPHTLESFTAFTCYMYVYKWTLM